MVFIPRRVRRLSANEPSDETVCQPLEELRDLAAWVLLGEPGAGKSVAFKQEAHETDGHCISIAKFLSDDPDPTWQGKTLYLDGLDETRASGGDTSILLKVRAHLRKLGNPRFRIACRAADWFGSTDSQAIGDASPNGQLTVFTLEPLNDSEIREILRQNHAISDPDSFMEKARQRGIDGLLHNPQTLRLLAESSGNGNEPSTRQETFEFACKKLAEEDSPEHRHQRRDQAISVERLMAAAGQLCAALLLSDKTGLALDAASADSQFSQIEELLPCDLSAAQSAVRRKLFVPSPNGEERVIPSHRSIAEFLAARWLARQIDDGGLPLRRVLNLFMGRDDRTVSGLRGLYGWLALHCQAARQRLIEADPVTVVVYGDVKPMPPEDKRKILAGLQQEAKQHLAFRWDIPSATPFGAMAQQELAAEFSAALSAPERDDASQSFADCVLDILSKGEPIPELAPTIKAVVMDDSRWIGVRMHALGVWLKFSPLLEEAVALLDSINDKEIADSEDILAGQLLSSLYPKQIAPDALFNYLHAPKRERHTSDYLLFWGHELARIAPDAHLPVLLDALAARYDLDFFGEELFNYGCRRMLGGLLSRGIAVYGDSITDERLFTWLGIGADKYGESRRAREHQEAIAAWLGQRAERYKAILALCYRLCEGSEHFRSCLNAQEQRLHGSAMPEDIGIWHLDLASQTANDELAENHLLEAIRSLTYQRGCVGLSLEKIEEWADANPKRKHWLQPMLFSEISEQHRERVANWRAFFLTRATQREEKSRKMLEQLSAIRDGSAAPGILHELASVWMNHHPDTHGNTATERFDSYCENRVEVLNAAEAGFALCPLRDNLPSVSEIIDISIKRREHYSISWPCLIGMELRWQQGASLVDELSDDCLRRMIAFRLTYGADSTPEWFTHLVRTRPSLVADVLIEYAGATLKARQDSVSGIYPLVHDAEYRGVAERAVLPLLAAFPVRAKSTQLSNLENLLKAALCYSVEGFAELIDKKLTVKAMDVAQKVYWLTAAMLLDPPKYETLLWQYIGRNWIRANHLCAFLDDRYNGISNDYALSTGTLGKLIELLSPHAEFGTGPMQRGESIQGMVTRLGAQATEEAAQEIERLRALPALSKLKHSLENARHQLRLKQREGAFRFPPLSSVAQILANREPANSADLAALAVEYLDQIAVAIRHDNDDGFRDFWNIENKKPTGKREENYCRDPLLRRLRASFIPFGVDCQPEGDYANDKRADIRLSYRNEFEVPIEIKRDDNRTLWKSLRDQLMGQYTVSPKTSGYGIYLVLWFGWGDQASHKDGGKKPSSPTELQARLEAQLDPDERRRVFVRVLDVSWPRAS